MNQLMDLDTESLEDEELDAILSDIGGGDSQAEQQAANRLLGGGVEYDNRGGLVTIYDTETGMPSQVLYYMLQKTLKLRRENGKRFFSLKQLVPYRLGSLLCMLHPQHPLRGELDTLGLAGRTCRKTTLQTALDVRRHMQHRHKDEWEVIQEAEEQVRRDEERAFRLSQTEFMQQQMAATAGRSGRPRKDEQ